MSSADLSGFTARELVIRKLEVATLAYFKELSQHLTVTGQLGNREVPSSNE
jgi:hypothetical protein